MNKRKTLLKLLIELIENIDNRHGYTVLKIGSDLSSVYIFDIVNNKILVDYDTLPELIWRYLDE